MSTPIGGIRAAFAAAKPVKRVPTVAVLPAAVFHAQGIDPASDDARNVAFESVRAARLLGADFDRVCIVGVGTWDVPR